MKRLKFPLAALLTGATLLTGGLQAARADEQLFGFARGAETLPQGHTDVYQYITLRTGKDEGDYYGFDFDTEVEYGFTDKFQASLAMVNHYFDYNNGSDSLSGGRFGGLETAAKYRLKSPFKDGYGLALRLEGGWLLSDEVGGLPQHEIYFAPEVDLQKNYRDDTIVTVLNFGPEFAWGKRPAEEYDHELSLQAATGISYRFAPNWFIGLEGNIRSEWPMFMFKNFEHVTFYGGPSLHYSAKRWWATVSVTPQIWGQGIDEPANGKTYAEESDWKFRLKVGFNF